MYTYIPSLLSLPPTPCLSPMHPGHHRKPSWAPCTIQQAPTGYLTHSRVYMSVQPPSSSHYLFPSSGPQAHSLHLCLYSCPANRFICTIFLDSMWFFHFLLPFLFQNALCQPSLFLPFLQSLPNTHNKHSMPKSCAQQPSKCLFAPNSDSPYINLSWYGQITFTL